MGDSTASIFTKNAFVRESSLCLHLDNCSHSFSIIKSPSLSTPGVTGAVMWDSGVILEKYLKHVGIRHAYFQGKKLLNWVLVVDLLAALQLFWVLESFLLTDLSNRLRLPKKNIKANMRYGNLWGSAVVNELIWGDDSEPEMIEPLPDYVLGLDVIYSEGTILDLLVMLVQLYGNHTIILLAGELQNDAIVEYFLESALKNFVVDHVDQTWWQP